MKLQLIVTAAVVILPSSSRDLPSITLRVVNEAQVDYRLLKEAQRETAGILHHVGVGLIWMDCSENRTNPQRCQSGRGRADFWFRVTTERPAWTSQENLGFTENAGGNGSGGVYYPAVVKLTEQLNGHARGIAPVAAYVPAFLGAAIAHEIGHLILGAHAHHAEGVMLAERGQEEFELIKLGGLNFARFQAKSLQIEVNRRVSEGGSVYRP